MSLDIKDRSRLIIRDKSSDSLHSDNRIAVSKKTSKVQKYMSRLKISIQQDLNPSNILDGIEEIDLEVDKIDRMIPPDLTEDEKNEIQFISKANKELREKVHDVSDLVRITLIKVNVSNRVLVY